MIGCGGPTRDSHRIDHDVQLLTTRILLLAGVAVLTGVAACSDEEGGDPDTTPFVAERCAIYWGRENPNDGSIDFYTVDLPVSDWVNGAGTFGGAREGWFAYRSPDGSLAAAMGLAQVPAGEFSLTLAGIEAGNAVTFVDGTAQALVDARAMTPTNVGTGGEGTFDGVWTDPGAETSGDVDWGAGTITVTYLGSSITLGGSAFGGMSTYGQCYAGDAAFAPDRAPGGRLFHGTRKGSR